MRALPSMLCALSCVVEYIVRVSCSARSSLIARVVFAPHNQRFGQPWRFVRGWVGWVDLSCGITGLLCVSPPCLPCPFFSRKGLVGLGLSRIDGRTIGLTVVCGTIGKRIGTGWHHVLQYCTARRRSERYCAIRTLFFCSSSRAKASNCRASTWLGCWRLYTIIGVGLLEWWLQLRSQWWASAHWRNRC